jgi:DNA modification methylase
MELYNEDCITGIRNRLKDNSIDCVVCDLPYFGVVDADFDNKWENEDDYLKWVESLVIQYVRVLKPGGSVFLFTSRQLNRKICNILDRYLMEKRIIIWARKRGFNNTRGHALASGYEPIAYYVKGGDEPVFNNIKIKPDTKRKEYTEGMLKEGVSLSDVWTDISALPHNSKEKTEHPTQKPVKLMERIIEMSSNEGDTVLDGCMGSGSTGVACLNLNRNFIGFEVDGKYFRIAEDRIHHINNEIKLF